mmetsp:Transcript_15503/g.29609  ORF Transcript_15503/g.29609 Transcript_15503/m.29609 type:complete len:848 (+) Transcript_15503:113-2656(+)|eukprot:scaffold1001_cov169-Amphora_coffeaeformis.AAC.7
MERSNFGVARSVFGSTVKRSPFIKRQNSEPSSTSTTTTSFSNTANTWRSRLPNRDNETTSSNTTTTNGPLTSRSHRTLPSSSSFADDDDDSAPPSKRIGAKLVRANSSTRKSPARPVRKLNISGAKPKEAAYRIKDTMDDAVREQTTPKTPKPIYRIRPETEVVADIATPKTPTTPCTPGRRKFTSSRSWKPKPMEGDEEEKKDPTTPMLRQSSWRKKLVSPHPRKPLSTNPDEEEKKKKTTSSSHLRNNNTHKNSSPQRAEADENHSKVNAPGSLLNSWQKSQEEQGKKIPSYLRNAPKTKNPSSTSSESPSHQQTSASPQRTWSPTKSPLKSPRRRIVFPPESPGTNPLSPVRDNTTATTTSTSPSPVSFGSPLRRLGPGRATLKLASAPKLDDESPPVSPGNVVVATSSSPGTKTTVIHKKRPIQATPEEQRAAVRVQTCWRTYHQQVKFLVLVKHERKMNKLKKKLANVEREKQKELDEIQRIVKDYKESSYAKAQKKKAAMVEKSEKAAEIERQASELKKENAQIQAKNEMLKKNTRNLRINNLRLEKSAESSKDYYEQLKLHHDRCLEDNQKLSKVDENYKTKVNELEENLATRTRYANAEHRIRGLYRQAIRDVVSMAEETSDESLILKVYEIQEEIGHLEESWNDPDPMNSTATERKKKLKLLREKWGDTLKSPRCKSKGRLASLGGTSQTPSSSRVKKSAIEIESSDSGDDPPRAKLPATNSKTNAIRANATDSDSSSSSSDDDEPRRGGRATTRGIKSKVSDVHTAAVLSDSDSSSSGDDGPTRRRVPVKPKLPDGDSSDNNDDAGMKKLATKTNLKTPPRRITPPTDGGSESDVSD